MTMVRTRRLSQALLVLANLLQPMAVLALSLPNPAFSRAGGRAPRNPNKVNTEEREYQPRPAGPTESRLILLQITDVYTLEYLASFQSMVAEIRAQSPGCVVKCLLTGDFLSPYLLASVDRGNGMMNALNRIPLDYLTWGNHEADHEHRVVCRHVRNFRGTWLNSNMLDHEAMDEQAEYDVLSIPSPDNSQVRKTGLVAVLSDDPALYSHHAAPGAFGGATIDNPWDTLKKYKKLLKDECDLIVPLQHLYVPDDHKTCRDFNFPVVLSGHDHHRVDEVVEGTRLLKPGMNAEFATVVEISWADADCEKPKIEAQFVRVSNYAPDPESEAQNERAYNALAPLRNTQLATVPSNFLPLTSATSRENVCSMAQFLCSLLRTSLNIGRKTRGYRIEAVVMMGGNFRGNKDYGNTDYFSLETLEAEIKADEVIAVVPMPGWLLSAGIEATHAGDAIPGWMQYDEGVIEEKLGGGTTRVTHVAGEPLDKDRIYRVATKISDLTNGQSPPWTEYFTENPQFLPPSGAYINIQAELLSHFARNLWCQLWGAIGADVVSVGGCQAKETFDELDRAGDGFISMKDIQVALRDQLGMKIDDREETLAEFVLNYADQTGDGTVTLPDLKFFRDEIEFGEGTDKDAVLVNELAPEGASAS